jgi:putative transposase
LPATRIRNECLDQVVLLGERHLRAVVREYVAHYHTERNHQGLGNEIVEPVPVVQSTTGPVLRRQRLGGLLNYYDREAA